MGCSTSVEKASVDTVQSETDGKGVNIKAGTSAMGEHKREPMLLLDTTGSMNWPTSETDRKERRETVHEAVFAMVTDLCKLDSQAKRKKKGGGLRTVTFAGEKAHDLGDLRPDNIRAVWDKIEWEGSTHLMPGWKKLLAVHETEFGRKGDVLLIALIITDGQAEDTREFEEHLMSLHGRVFVVLAIVGYGQDHDDAFAQYQQIEANNKLGHLRVVSLADAPNQGQFIADTVRGFLQADDIHAHDFRAYAALQQQQQQQLFLQQQQQIQMQQQPVQVQQQQYVYTDTSNNSSAPAYNPDTVQ